MKLYTTMPPLIGATKVFNELRGKQQQLPTLLYFWSLSCPQCEEALIKLKAVYTRYEQRIFIQTVHMPRTKQDTMSRLKEKLHELQLPFSVYADEALTISDAFGNRIVPAYYLFDDARKLRFLKYGFLSTKLLQQKIDRIIQ